MDAVSFVLGIQSAHLRSSNLAELIYRDGSGEEGSGEDGKDGRGKRRKGDGPKHASVSAFYTDSHGQDLVFSRTYQRSTDAAHRPVG